MSDIQYQEVLGRNDKLEEVIGVLQTQLRSVETDLKQMKIERDICKDKNKDLEKELDDGRKRFTEDFQLLKQVNTELLEVNAILLDEQKSYKTDNFDLKNVISELKCDQTNLKQERIKIEKGLKSEIELLKSELEIEKKEIDEIKSTLEDSSKLEGLKAMKKTNVAQTIAPEDTIESEETKPTLGLSMNKLKNRCSHIPQCALRDPNPPPPFAPVTQQEFYSSPQPPAMIRLLPQSVDSFQEFRKLNNSHHCEECEEGSLFYNYYEMVQYPDPGPCGGTSGRPVTTCPNNPNSSVTVLSSTAEDRRRPWWYKKKTYKCDLCEQNFTQTRHMRFHRNRCHKND